jgi:hypothetical protein
MALIQTVSRLWYFPISNRTAVAYETGYNHFLFLLLLNGVILVESKPCSVTEDTLIYFVAHFFRILNCNSLLVNYIYQALGINAYKAILIPLFSIPVTHWRDYQ